MKLCDDCKHSSMEGESSYCLSPRNMTDVNPINGVRAARTYMYCFSHRSFGPFAARFFECCGKEARWFEPKEPA